MAMLDFVQQLVSGIALGCVYGLIALGFVLVYKATEVVNFAQGDLMMLGGFFAFTFIGILGLNYWIGFAAAVAAMALFGMLAERVVVRPILGYPQFSIIMATIGLGYFLRSVVGMIWGTDDFKIETPFSHGVMRIGSLVLADDKLSVIAATICSSTAPRSAPRCGPVPRICWRPITWAYRSSAWCRSCGRSVQPLRPAPGCCWRRSRSFIPMSVWCSG
jgi:branched-subunit amino acid ABC-type transport system permease component